MLHGLELGHTYLGWLAYGSSFTMGQYNCVSGLHTRTCQEKRIILYTLNRTETKTTLCILVQPYLLCVTMNNTFFVVFFLFNS